MHKNMYPRPQFEREEWLNLNGEWDFEYDDLNIGIKEKWYEEHTFTKKINVPFTFETKLSGIEDTSRHDIVWYQRYFEIPKEWNKRVIINFGAIDYRSKIYINGHLVGENTGGHISFSYDITDYLVKDKKQKITIYVYDPSKNERIPRGKQTWTEESHGIWYARTTGIWQTVWLEHLDQNALTHVKMTPDLDQGKLRLDINTNTELNKKVRVIVKDNGTVIIDDVYSLKENVTKELTIWKDKIFDTNLHHSGKTWTPENPHLFDIDFELYVSDKLVDKVKSYFGMRKVHTENGMVYLNNRPYYLRLILDQGYYKESLLTSPNDDALINDIKLSKEMGFNGCRKHQKIEEERFLYYADKLGYLVWEEMPSTAIYDTEYHTDIIQEWGRAIHRDYNHPSIIAWVPLNESWGVPNIQRNLSEQQYAMALYYLTKSIDQTRLVISNDGWEQVQTDICAIHNYHHGSIDDTLMHEEYAKSIKTKDAILNYYPAARGIFAEGYSHQEQPMILTEFGGISFRTEEMNGWGYSNVNNEKDFLIEYERLIDAISQSEALAGFCYTQLTDVEQEVNGLLTYTRKAKVSLEKIRKINEKARFVIAHKR